MVPDVKATHVTVTIVAHANATANHVFVSLFLFRGRILKFDFSS